MSFSNPNTDRKTYVNIVNGKFAIRAKEGEVAPDGTKATSRIIDEKIDGKKTGNQKTVWEFLYRELTAELVSIKANKNEKIKANEYVIECSSIGEKIQISVPADSRYGDNLASKIHNIKAGVETYIAPYDFEDANTINKFTGKPQKQVGITIKQGGEKLVAYFTDATPNGRPARKEGMTETEYKIYGLQLRDFYKQQIDKWNEKNVSKPNTSAKDKAVAESMASEVEDSDLPF